MTTTVEIKKDYLEEYERLKSNISMFLTEVNALPNSDSRFINEYQKLKSMYFQGLE